MLQISKFFRNDDSSAISLEKFSDDEGNDKYPTYTFCFEDSSRGDMYLRLANAMADHGNMRLFSPIDPCPYLKLEENKLFCSDNDDMKRNAKGGNITRDLNESDSKAYQYQPPSFIDWSSDGIKFLISTDHYRNLLIGNEQKYIGMLVHQHEEIKYSVDEISKIKFDDQVINVRDYLMDYSIKIDNGSSYGWIDGIYENLETSCCLRDKSGYGDSVCGTQDSFKASVQRRMHSFNPPFMKIYQDPTKICYSPRLSPEWKRKHDHFTLDLTEMKKSFLKSPNRADSTVLTVYIHMKGQFMRSIGKEHFSLNRYDLDSHCLKPPNPRGGQNGRDPEEYCYGISLNFDITHVTLLKNRHDAKSACDPYLNDEDFKILESIVNDSELNCVPIFWIGIYNFSSFYPTCKKHSQYKRINDLMVNFTLVSDSVRTQFKPPCEELLIESNNQRIKGRKVEEKSMSNKNADNISVCRGKRFKRQYIDFDVRLLNDRYQMIKNNREFDFESCVSGIGGFIGMFIGLSLRQIPEIVCQFYQFLCKIKVME